MDREWLQRELEGGRSIGDIAREVDRHPARVSYWMGKYGLSSQHARVFAARGASAKGGRRAKAILVTELGGRCALCGYDRGIPTLQFDHLEA